MKKNWLNRILCQKGKKFTESDIQLPNKILRTMTRFLDDCPN